ncbi:peptidase dimerization domain-containing protein [Pseudomonas baetica]|uniref:peptidase dimerization domain-containing protein n=1 Tax=Pseudomonas baetica TaxID=674054 RepID=UPI002406586B|nr:peptidase dimerization domain-containing protein [Pseudomonas baetica]
MFGRGAHGSQPQTSVDPVIMAASTVLRLQTIVSREISPLDQAVLTVGSLQAGTKENIIPDNATLKLKICAPTTRACASTCSAPSSGSAAPNALHPMLHATRRSQ